MYDAKNEEKTKKGKKEKEKAAAKMNPYMHEAELWFYSVMKWKCQ